MRSRPIRRACAGVAGVVAGALMIALPASAAQAAPGELPSHEQWQADVRSALSGAPQYLEGAASRGGGRPAVVLDIDNTALETDYNEGRANRPVLEVAEQAKRLGMSVLIVSAREVGGEDRSLGQLRAAGYAPDAICLRRSGEGKAEGKSRCRAGFAGEGYVITANIGNRSTDFEGGHYDRAFRLPDYGNALT